MEKRILSPVVVAIIYSVVLDDPEEQQKKKKKKMDNGHFQGGLTRKSGLGGVLSYIYIFLILFYVDYSDLQG